MLRANHGQRRLASPAGRTQDGRTMREISRRDALHTLALAATAVACRPPEEPKMTAPPQPAVDPVVRVLPLGEPPWPTLDPFLFCVHHDDAYPAGNGQFGPAASLAGRFIGQDFAGIDGWRMYHGRRVPGFPSHPHRGFETVTITRKGLIDHADSMGAAARYGEGDVQWLTAGRGIQHAEMFPLLREDGPNPCELFQIWLNLPARDKFAEPHFSMLWAPSIPRQVVRDAAGHTTELTVIAGTLGELRPPSPPPKSWASQADSDVAIWTLKLQPGAQWTLPPARTGSHRRLYVFRGPSLQVGPRTIEGAHAVDVRPELAVALRGGAAETEVLVLQGRPIGEPTVSHGPFVMNTREQIQQAWHDYQRTGFGGWPWPNEAPVHGREGRFARRPGAPLERPA
jgi:redox-sensitive bicupin YhaK (pirin superfamily)